MTTVVSFFIVIGLLIVIHELGHFMVARWSGVGVERFSIGFGPVLLRWKGKETEYCLSAVPFGGYVKMMGEESPLEGEGGRITDPDKSFPLKPLWARAIIVFAGPGMNFVLAAVIYALVFMISGVPTVRHPSTLGRVAEDGPAAQAGLRSGDRVVAVDETPVAHWEDLIGAIQASGGGTRRIVFVRDGREQTTDLTPERKVQRDAFGDDLETWYIGASPFLPAKIGSVLPGEPAAKAGLRPDDTVIALDGIPVRSWDAMAREIRKRPETSTEITVERGGKVLTVVVVPRSNTERDRSGEEVTIGRIGISPAVVTYVRSNPVVAAGQGFVHTWGTTVLIAKGLWKIITGQLSVSNLGGPILIAQFTGQQAKQGLPNLALLTALISINLAILNLLPVPVLDGGHLLFFAIEGLMGRPLSLKKRELAQQVGLVLLLMLMVFVVYNDLARIFK